ncbi:hypothetical protein [Pseudomonas sp. PB106]|uniref:hypothetical protein n=1 Tax=Pseudomonas sp. PB106 TaxID=2494699 RepID=UPI0015B778CE|nr:hypothetical protein [Pseudomonas sp. PB106]
MGEVDDLTRERLREWQLRRLEIKDQMQDHPERTLELSRVLDLMDDEHAEILAAATIKATGTRESASSSPVEHGLPQFDVQLRVAARSAEDLRKLLELALYEVQAQIDRNPVAIGEDRSYPGDMSGTLGEYHFTLRINDERADKPALNEVAHLAGKFSPETGAGPAAHVRKINEAYDQD